MFARTEVEKEGRKEECAGMVARVGMVVRSEMVVTKSSSSGEESAGDISHSFYFWDVNVDDFLEMSKNMDTV